MVKVKFVYDIIDKFVKEKGLTVNEKFLLRVFMVNKPVFLGNAYVCNVCGKKWRCSELYSGTYSRKQLKEFFSGRGCLDCNGCRPELLRKLRIEFERYIKKREKESKKCYGSLFMLL